MLIGGLQALYGPALPAIRGVFQLGTGTAGWTLSAHFIGSISGVVLSLLVETRISPRRRSTAGLGCVVAGSLAFALIPVWPWALGGVLLIGVGYGLLVVVVNAMFAIGFGERSAAMLILVNAGFGLGAALGPGLFGLLTSSDFRPAFIVAAIVAVGVIPLTPAFVGQPDAEVEVSLPSQRSTLVLLVAFVGIFLLYTALESDVSGWEATHLVFQGFSRATAANLTALFWILFTAGRLLAVPVSLRLSPIQILIGSLIAATGCAVLAHVTRVTPVAYALMGLALAPIFPVSFAWMGRSLPAVRGAASFALLGALLGGSIFPFLVGRLMSARSPDILPSALVVVAVAALLVCLTVPGLIRREVADQRTGIAGT